MPFSLPSRRTRTLARRAPILLGDAGPPVRVGNPDPC